MPTATLILAALLVLAVNVYGWRVIPDETRIGFRLLIFGSRETTGKNAGLVMWLLPELFVLGGSAVIDDPAGQWIGLGLLVFLLLQHFFAIRRLRPIG